jgi:hypothetical protein
MKIVGKSYSWIQNDRAVRFPLQHSDSVDWSDGCRDADQSWPHGTAWDHMQTMPAGLCENTRQRQTAETLQTHPQIMARISNRSLQLSELCNVEGSFIKKWVSLQVEASVPRGHGWSASRQPSTHCAGAETELLYRFAFSCMYCR